MSDLPADTLTTTIANALASPEVIEVAFKAIETRSLKGDFTGRETMRNDAAAALSAVTDHVAAAVVSVLATHNEHTAANALRDAADELEGNNASAHVRQWLRARADRLAAVSPTPPTHKEQARGPRPCPQRLNDRVCTLNNFHPGDHEWAWTPPDWENDPSVDPARRFP